MIEMTAAMYWDLRARSGDPILMAGLRERIARAVTDEERAFLTAQLDIVRGVGGHRTPETLCIQCGNCIAPPGEKTTQCRVILVDGSRCPNPSTTGWCEAHVDGNAVRLARAEVDNLVVVNGERVAALALTAAAQIDTEEHARIAREREKEEAHVADRLAPDDSATDSLAGASVPAVDPSRSIPNKADA